LVFAAADDIDMVDHQMQGFHRSSNDEIGTIMIWLEGFYTRRTIRRFSASTR